MKVIVNLSPVVVRLTIVVSIACMGAEGLVAYRGMHREESHSIKVSGNIELNEVQIAFKTSGRLIERRVDEGDIVEKGMIVARLDRDQLLRKRDGERAARASAEAMMAQAETAAEWKGQPLAADIDLRHA